MMPFSALFFALKKAGLKVSLGDWMSVMDALKKDVVEPTVDDFYFVTRALVCKSESHFDLFDQCFLQTMKGIETLRSELEKLLEWLRDPKAPAASLQVPDQLSLEELLKKLEERLKEQKERHDGGHKWVGTGGTSPFGQGGVNSGGIRIGSGGGSRSAVQVAEERRFRDYRDDIVLDERGMSLALKRLRRLSRNDQPLELDVEESVDRTCKNAGELELAFTPPRKNQARVILLMDTGGSMDPFSDSVEQLFTAATKLNHWKKLEAYAFHNCVYEKVYTRIADGKNVPTSTLIDERPTDTYLIMVGDAYMAPFELTERYGAVSLAHHNLTPGIVWLHRLRAHFRNAVWLNPMPERHWSAGWTIKTISEIVPMFSLTLRGLEDAVRHLVRGQPPPLPELDPRFTRL
jgi:uncharacterized protein